MKVPPRVGVEPYVHGPLGFAIAEKLSVASKLGVVNCTLPGPIALVQNVLSVPPAGKPSSVTVPCRLTGSGDVISLLGPALTTGAALAEMTTVTSELAVNSESLAVNRST